MLIQPLLPLWGRKGVEEPAEAAAAAEEARTCSQGVGRAERKTLWALPGALNSALPGAPTNPYRQAESHPARATEILTVVQATRVLGQPGERRS